MAHAATRNILVKPSHQQIERRMRLGSLIRRIEPESHDRRETTSGYLADSGIPVLRLGSRMADGQPPTAVPVSDNATP